MRANQTKYDSNNKQVALFPLEYINVSQPDDGTYSHESWYYATDYLGWNSNGRVYRCPCYAPVDITCKWLDRAECCALWVSNNPVHLANGMIDYLGILVYHDNDIQDGITQVGTVKRMGEVFNRTGTGGNITGDHMHLETGFGRYTNYAYSTGRGTAEYKFHFTDYTNIKRLHNYDALFINDTVNYYSPSYYNWKTFSGGSSSGTRHKFKWVLYTNKLRNKQM